MPNKLKRCYHGIWDALHLMSFTVKTKEEERGIVTVLDGLTHCLPCETCRVHLREFIASNEQPSGNCAQYILDLHNRVNRGNGKREWNMEQASKKYGKMADACGVFESKGDGTFNENKLHWSVVTLIAACVCVLVLFLCLRTCHVAGCSI